MVTAVNERTYDLRGLSSDTKPHGPNVSNWDGTTTWRIANGSTFFEMDTGTAYIYSITGETEETPGTGEWIAL